MLSVLMPCRWGWREVKRIHFFLLFRLNSVLLSTPTKADPQSLMTPPTPNHLESYLPLILPLQPHLTQSCLPLNHTASHDLNLISNMNHSSCLVCLLEPQAWLGERKHTQTRSQNTQIAEIPTQPRSEAEKESVLKFHGEPRAGKGRAKGWVIIPSKDLA